MTNSTTDAQTTAETPVDITARLRSGSRGQLRTVCHEAAAEIERLRAALTEIEWLRAVIRINAIRWNPALTLAEIDEVIRG